MSILSDRLRATPRGRGLLQRELAESLDLSRVAITQYEQGRRVPEVDILTKIADFFMVSVDYLLGRTDVRIMCAATHQPETTTQSNKQSADILPMGDSSALKTLRNSFTKNTVNLSPANDLLSTSPSLILC